jgi:tRNA threonylcarbamoyladenosine biosynthesis protein TsaE
MEMDYTLKEIKEVAEQIILNARTKTLLFYGEMGVGKTTLIKELAKKLGVKDLLSSPTFSIINEYTLESDKLYHFDCYRLKDEKEAFDIGIEEYLETGHWKLIEWPEIIETFVSEEATKIRLTKNQNGSRTLKIMPVN